MKSLTINTWVQTLTTSAVLIGVGLVVWELRQTKELVEAQLISEKWAARTERLIALMGEDSAKVIAKACQSPDKLKPEEMQILNALFHGELSIIQRSKNISTNTGLSVDYDWERLGPVNFRQIFSLPYGRYWWARVRNFFHQFDPELAKIGDDTLDSVGDYTCASIPNGYLKALQAGHLSYKEGT